MYVCWVLVLGKREVKAMNTTSQKAELTKEYVLHDKIIVFEEKPFSLMIHKLNYGIA